MIDNNLKCTQCSHTFLIPKVLTFADGSIRDHKRQHIKCPQCGSVGIVHFTVSDNPGIPEIASFTTKSLQDRESYLRKRAKKANAKNVDERRDREKVNWYGNHVQ